MTKVQEMACIDATRSYSVEDLRHLLKTTSFRGFPVLRVPRSRSGAHITDSDVSHKPTENVLLGYISRTELAYALDHARKIGGTSSPVRSATTMCFFMHSSELDPSTSVDLRPWMDQTPITLHASSTVQLVVSMFQKLGLRYLLLVEKGSLKGILTKKDIWWVLNASEVQGTSPAHAEFMPGLGVLRAGSDLVEDPQEIEEAEGLLRDDER